MINIKIIHLQDYHLILAKGHATGSVEVCAAVSTVLQILAGYCTCIGTPAHAHFESGLAILGLRPEHERYMDLCVFGLRCLARDNPDLITISEEHFDAHTEASSAEKL